MAEGPLGRRLLWFAALWAGGVGTVALVGLLLRRWLLG
ncbi:MAG: DUF2474 domain-containing protein [Sphingomonadales bacterium]|jgi:hypothetical protein